MKGFERNTEVETIYIEGWLIKVSVFVNYPNIFILCNFEEVKSCATVYFVTIEMIFINQLKVDIVFNLCSLRYCFYQIRSFNQNQYNVYQGN